MILKETNKHLREIKCPFCGYKYVKSDTIKPLGDTNFIREKCKICKDTFWWIREIKVEYKIAIEE